MIYLIHQNLDIYIYCVTKPGRETEFYFKEYEIDNNGIPKFNLGSYPVFAQGYETVKDLTGVFDENQFAYKIENELYLIDYEKRIATKLASNVENALYANKSAVIKYLDDDKLYYLDKTTMNIDPVCSLYDFAHAEKDISIVDYMAGFDGDVYILLSDGKKYYACQINATAKTHKMVYCINTPRRLNETERIFYTIDAITVSLGNDRYIITLIA